MGWGERREPKQFPLDGRGQPHPIDMIRDLREELGLFSGAMSITPQDAWEEAIATVREMRRARV